MFRLNKQFSEGIEPKNNKKKFLFKEVIKT